MMNHLGKLYMIPCPIVEWEMATIPEATITALHQIDHFVVERLRTARRFISQSHHPIAIDNMTFFEYNKHQPTQGLSEFLQKLKSGVDVGVLSEAGCPGIADPGKNAVMYAHQIGAQVVPLVGPSSIMLALMSSGFNGQRFEFHGYLPNKKPELSKQLKVISSRAQQGITQIFMEAPYRNKFILQSCCDILGDRMMLCLACDINAPDEYIKTMAIKEWKKVKLDQFHKRPAIFLIG